MPFKWTPNIEDAFLSLMLPCDNEVEYQRALVKFGKDHNRSSALSLDEGENYLRRRAKRRTEYNGYGLTNRQSRENLPWSWVELRILDWARDWQTEGLHFPDAEYLSHLLCRSIDEIFAEQERQQTTRHGMEELF